jgi:hypothetical protein
MTALPPIPIHPVDGPITAVRLEHCLDRLAFIMSRRADGGVGFLPLYRRIERDIAEQRAVEDALAQARERARRPRFTGTI